MTDVFISYAHLDNIPFGEEQKRWVDDFHRDLATRLQHLRRAPVSIWRDPKLLGNDVFGAEIEERVKDASVLLVVLSPPYSESEWCRKELDLFLRAAEEEQRLQFGNQLVVVKVVKLLVDDTAVPERLRSTLGYQFYREDPEAARYRELFLHPDPEIRRTYWPKVDDVAQDLVRLLDACGQAALPGPPVPAGPTVYLAESTSDLARERDVVRRELTARGFRVLPDAPLPLRAGDLERAVDAALADAVLSVHLLGARYGVVPEGTDRSLVAVQHERASRRQIPRVLWIPPGLRAAEEAQRAFLESVRQDPAAGDRVDVLEAPLEELKTLVVTRLEKPQPKAAAPAALRDAALPPFVYVVSDRADAAEMPALEARLRAAGFEVAQTAFEGDVTQLREDHEETLRVCDAVLIYWGKGDDLWRRAKLRDLIRIRGRGRTQPFAAQAVFLADPPSPAKDGFTTLEATVLRDADAFVRLVSDGKARVSSPLPLPGALHPVNPFPGLRPYEASETHLFFGRDAQVDALLRRLHGARLLAVVGTSGCGKSSLVRAGLLPALAGGYLADVGSRWRIAVLRPGTDPIDRLAHALARDGGPDEVAQVETTLRRSSLGLIEAVRLSPAAAGDATLVVVDQFEELFRFQETDADPAEAAAFVKLLLEASAQRELPIYVLITMRSDFLGDCAQYHGLPEALNEGQYLVPQMTRDQRREALAGPAAIAGAAATPRLMQRVLNDAGDDPQALPVLQHALTRTFARWLAEGGTGPLDLQQYQGAGGVADALDRHADEVFDALPDTERAVAERVFRALTERDASGRERRRPARLRALFAITGAATDEDRARVRSVVRTFAAPGSGFLSVSRAPDAEEDDAVVDITHESLIRAWTQLRVWVRDEALSAEWFKRIVRSAELLARKEEGYWRDPGLAFAIAVCERNHWNADWAGQYGGGFDEGLRFLQESARAQDALRRTESARQAEALQTREHALRTRRLAGLAGAGVLVFAALAGVAWFGWSHTRRALREAEASRLEALAVRQEAVDQRSTLLKEQRELVTQVESLQKEGEQLASVVRERVPVAVRPADIIARALRVGDRTADRLGLVDRKRPFGPGFSVSGESSGIGSACCLVLRGGRHYLLGLTLVFGTREGASVLQPGTGSPDSAPVARLAFAGDDPLTSAALAELLPGVQFDPRLVVTNRPFAGSNETVAVGDEVHLLGRGSGYVSGDVLSVSPSEIVTTGISTGGDAGAPVFDDAERLVGVLWSGADRRKGDRISRVIPIRRLLDEAGAALETSAATVTGAPRARSN